MDEVAAGRPRSTRAAARSRDPAPPRPAPPGPGAPARPRECGHRRSLAQRDVSVSPTHGDDDRDEVLDVRGRSATSGMKRETGLDPANLVGYKTTLGTLPNPSRTWHRTTFFKGAGTWSGWVISHTSLLPLDPHPQGRPVSSSRPRTRSRVRMDSGTSS